MVMANNRSLQKENSRWIRGEQIGKGSFGTVSVGFDRRNGRVFAVKSVPVSFAPAAQADAIENEISILRSLSSPFVVEYYGDDRTTEPGTEYRNLHMEYLAGGTAADLAKSGAGEEDLLRRYTRCLVSALRYVHSKGIVHCDVKGRNVLLAGDNLGTAKLADFGSARMVDDRMARIVPRGSPLWMAPEVVRGESQGFEADVWALGCTVIEMLSGSPAWRDEGANTLCRIGYSDELPRFPTRLSDLGIDFLDKCLRRDPARRWSCDQLLQHPFLCVESTAEIGDSPSPRSVFERPRLEEEDGVALGSDAGSCVDCGVSSAGGRIGKLAGSARVNWESDGWVGVRCTTPVGEVDSYVGFSGSEEAGTSWEFLESWGAEVKSPLSTVAGDLGGGCGDDGLAAVAAVVAAEESRKFTFTAVKTTASYVSGELLYLLQSILYYTNHPSYCDINRRNMPFFICNIVFLLLSMTIQVYGEFILLRLLNESQFQPIIISPTFINFTNS